MTRVVNLRYKLCDIYIGRPGKYGNPWWVGKRLTRDEAVDNHWEWLHGRKDAPDGRQPPTIEEIKKVLTGKRLGCFCAPKRCHGDNYVTICEKKNESM